MNTSRKKNSMMSKSDGLPVSYRPSFLKISVRYLFYALFFGLLVWVLDSVLDYFYFYQGQASFFEILFSRPPEHEFYIRSMILLTFLVFGFLISIQIFHKQKAERRRDHLSAVLKAIRNVNQLITHETDRSELIRKSCESLVETRGYFSAWIVLLDSQKNYWDSAQAGLGQEFDQLLGKNSKGEFPECMQKVLSEDRMIITKSPAEECAECPLSHNYPDRGAMSVPLKYKNEVLGVLVVSIPLQLLQDQEEQGLFREVAGDIAFGLNAIEVKKQKEEQHRQLKKSQKEWQDIFQAIGHPTIIVSPDFKIIDANTATCETLDKNKEELIGQNCYEVFHKNSDAPEGCPLQAVIQSGLKESAMMEMEIMGGIYMVNCNPVFDENGNLEKIIHISTDISELKTAQEAVEHSRKRFQTYIENAPHGIFIIDHNGKYVEVNPAAAQMTGYTQNELQNMHFSQLIHPDYIEASREHFKKTIKNGYAYGENSFVTKEGEQRFWQVDAIKLSDDRFLGMAVDVTERKIYHEKLMKSEENIRVTLDSLGDAVISTDVQGHIRRMNPIAKNLTGYEGTEAIGKPLKDIFEIVNAKTHEKVDNPVAKVLETGEIVGLANHTMLISKEGKEYQIADSAAPIYDTKRQIIGVVMVFRDVTEEYRIRQEINENKELLESTMNAIPDAIGVLTPELELVNYNEAGYELLKKNPDEVIGRKCYHLINRKTPCPDCAVIKSLESGQIEKVERYEKDLGIWVNLRAYPIIDENGNVQKVIEHFQDITERKQSEQKLQQLNEELNAQNEEYLSLNEELKASNDALVKAKEKAEESDRLKSAFLANMSHEIRTPMNGIMGFARLLKDENYSAQQEKQYLDVIERSGQRMLNTINDLIDISRIEAGQVDVHFSLFNFNKQLRYLCEFFRPEAEARGLELNCHLLLKDDDAIIETDEDKFVAILTNLLKNAIKYTREGKIEFGYSIKKTEVEFYVEDTGIGISKDYLASVFDRFVQAENKSDVIYEGSGLGLSISKAYLKMMGGDINVESEEGKGSRFFFRLPFQKLSEPEQKKEPTRRETYDESFLKDITFLIVEDESTSDFYLSELLGGSCKKILHARNGKEAIEMLEKENSIDVILMDIKMPVMDGLEATRKIREFDNEVKIIAQTAYALAGDHEKAIGAGCDDYLTKPINRDQLMDILSFLLKPE